MNTINNLRIKRIRGILLLLCLLATASLAAQCKLACSPALSVSLNSTCEYTLTYRDVLLNADDLDQCAPDSTYQIAVQIGADGPPISTSPVIGQEYVGQTLFVRITHLDSGNSCSTTMQVEDNQAPTVVCPADTTVTCGASIASADLGEPVVVDCSDFVVTMHDELTYHDCSSPFLRTVNRTWKITDGAGNQRECLQRIRIARPDIGEVVFPPDYNDRDSAALPCETVYPDPDITGYPSISSTGNAFEQGCQYNVTYRDQVTNNCGRASYTIHRQWTVVNICTYAIEKHTQVIAVRDKTPPIIDAPDTLFALAGDNGDCTADLRVEVPMINDNCGGSMTVRIESPAATRISGNLLEGLPVGVHQVRYLVEDACGNVGEKSVTLIVEDKVEPTMFCQEGITLDMEPGQTRRIYAEDVARGTIDNCCLEKLEIKRSDALEDDFGAFATIDCADQQAVSMVVRATDCHGNENFCTVEIRLRAAGNAELGLPEDLTIQVVDLPDDRTLQVTDPLDDLNLTGKLIVRDFCGDLVNNITYQDLDNRNSCGIGKVERRWYLEGPLNPVLLHQQRLYVVDDTEFEVSFPKDYQTADCVQPNDLLPALLDAQYGFPTVSESAGATWEIAYRDSIVAIDGAICQTIYRIWRVTNYCAVGLSGQPQVFEHIQKLEIIDQTSPLITCPDDVEISLPAGSSTVSFTVPALVQLEECNTPVDIRVSSPLGQGPTFQDIGLGTYPVTYTVTDPCGNPSSCSFQLRVVDRVGPVVSCRQDYSVTIDFQGTLTIPAERLDAGSVDNTTASQNLQYRIGPPPLPGTTQPPASDEMVFSCGDVGDQRVALWVGDELGNWNFCVTTITIDDRNGNCSLGFTIAGDIVTEQGRPVEEVAVSLSGKMQEKAMTDVSGYYQFRGVPIRQMHRVQPERQDVAQNGISTLDLIGITRHILHIDLLDSPYQMIAADANGSGTITTMDVLLLREVLLGERASFGQVPNWHFIPRNFRFSNPANPFLDALPGYIEFMEFERVEKTADFIAVKTGDINNSARTAAGGAASRSRGATLPVVFYDMAVPRGQLATVPVYLKEAYELAGLQLGLRVDPEWAALLGCRRGAWQSPALDYALQGDTLLLVTWLEAEPRKLPADEPLFYVEVMPHRAAHLSELLTIDDTALAGEAYPDPASGEVLPVDLQSMAELNTEWSRLSVSDLKVFPNPFTNEVNWFLLMEQPAQIQLSIWDISGRLIVSHTVDGQSGENLITIPASRFPAKGNYIYRLVAGSFIETGEIILSK